MFDFLWSAGGGFAGRGRLEAPAKEEGREEMKVEVWLPGDLVSSPWKTAALAISESQSEKVGSAVFFLIPTHKKSLGEKVLPIIWSLI